MALLKKQGLWPEQVAYNCLLNWVFLTGKRCCLLTFGYHSHGHGRMPPWGCMDGKGGNRLRRY